MMKFGVHNGSFHADDAFCVALMRSIYGEIEVVRTRDEELLKQCDIVADVGNGKYDHHDVDKKLRDNGIPYCGFGLLWQDFGMKYLEAQFPELTDEAEKKEVFDKIDKALIIQIDAQDNGVDVMQSEVHVTTLAEIIDSFAPISGTEAEMEKGFFEAADFAKSILFKTANKYVQYINNVKIVKEEIEKQDTENTHILVLEKSLPWKDAVLDFDKEEHILYVVYQDITGSWCIQVALKERGSFAARKNLPKNWGGLRNEEMSKETGVDGCIFCHPALFICGNKTKEGALQLAKMAVEL